MHLIYIDDSGDEHCSILSALTIPESTWRECFNRVKEFRRALKQSDGIFVYYEFHAWKFVSGRGRVSDQIVTKGRRCQIFAQALEMVATLPGARLFNAFSATKNDEKMFDWLLNRINRTMREWGSHAILICDEGKEIAYTKLARKMSVYNPIPSQYGVWLDTGAVTKNITTDLILEDPFFKDSSRSYFIQLIDFCSYALLRRERPLASKSHYGLDTCFNLLSPILVREATKKDPDGILRV